MTVLLVVLTLCCLALPGYVYAGYPILLWLLCRGRPAVTHRQGPLTPRVALVISCYNEIGVIRQKLDNALALDYPGDRLTIWVVSDGSDDGTDEVAREYADRGVRLVRQEGRLGKTMGLNLVLEEIPDDIVVFSDANAMYATDAIRMLVRNFQDPEVGYVVGAALYTDGASGASARNEGLYWRYELAIKTMESRLSSVVGGDGAIYAIRRRLWQPLQQRDINDFVNPLQIVAQGYRGVFDPLARCYEETAGEFSKEISRKERIVNRSIRGLMRVREVMNPFRSGLFAWQVVSHKLLRWLVPLFLAVGVLGSAILASQGLWLFQLITAGALVVVLAAGGGHLLRHNQGMPMLFSAPYYFVMVNLYALKGIWRALQGQTQVTWTSARASESGGAVSVWGSGAVLWLVTLAVLVGSLGWGVWK